MDSRFRKNPSARLRMSPRGLLLADPASPLPDPPTPRLHPQFAEADLLGVQDLPAVVDDVEAQPVVSHLRPGDLPVVLPGTDRDRRVPQPPVLEGAHRFLRGSAIGEGSEEVVASHHVGMAGAIPPLQPSV
jgi:hypothetical protein